jgi:hypothetical protein
MADDFAISVGTPDRVLAAQIKQVFNNNIINDLEPSDIGAVASTVDGISGASVINNIVSISQANYDALATKDANTLYVIV